MSKHAPPLANFALYRAARRTISHCPHASSIYVPRSFKMRLCIWGHRVCRNLAHVGAHNSDWVFFFGPTVSIFNFNGLVHCVSADRAPTYPAADRKTKPSDREARAQLGDHDPPTPRDRAERSARALLACFRGRWPDLKIAVAGFDLGLVSA